MNLHSFPFVTILKVLLKNGGCVDQLLILYLIIILDLFWSITLRREASNLKHWETELVSDVERIFG